MSFRRIVQGILFFSLCSPFLQGAPQLPSKGGVEARLKDPSFRDGTLKTDLGGVITAEGIRIQAQSIAYTDTVKDGERVLRVKAGGDLLFSYQGEFFTGSELEYDFIRRTGYLSSGRAGYGIWFFGGDLIRIDEDGTLTIENGFVTTSENQQNDWAVRAKTIKISKEKVLSASGIRLNLGDVPVLWLPSFKSDLDFVADTPIRYKVMWDKGLGPRVTVRYRVFSNEELQLFTRLDYRFSKGPGAAFESEYYGKDGRTVFLTRSYGAYDKEVYDEHGLKRYRLQGVFRRESLDGKTRVHLTYDKFRDLKMLSDFPSSDFEVNTEKRSRLLIDHQEEAAFGSFDVSPRLNTFESLNQKLPLGKGGIKPFSIGKTGIFSENFVSAGYLNYVYASDLLATYPTLRETASGRLETRNRLYRPFAFGPVRLTPAVGIVGLFYSNNPEKRSVGQGVFTYEGSVSAPFYKKYSRGRHTVEPYLRYLGISRPKARLSNHYTFTIEDGLYRMNSLRAGVRNTFSFANGNLFSPDLLIDLYTYGFFADATFTKTFPKQYLTVSYGGPSALFEANGCFNAQESVLDFANLLTKVTVSETTAFIAEFRHRSRFDWRKADKENFLVDMARTIPELLNSPLSDGRNTLLAKLQIRFSPEWNCAFASHYGWGRKEEPSYHSFKVDTTALLSSKWQLKLSYTHTTNDDRFSVQMQLVR